MKTVYVLMKHPRHPYSSRGYLVAGEIKGVFQSGKEAKAECDLKNSRKPYGLYKVHAKRIKEPTNV